MFLVNETTDPDLACIIHPALQGGGIHSSRFNIYIQNLKVLSTKMRGCFTHYVFGATQILALAISVVYTALMKKGAESSSAPVHNAIEKTRTY